MPLEANVGCVHWASIIDGFVGVYKVLFSPFATVPLFIENDLSVIDSYDYLRSQKDPKEIKTMYLADDTHWNCYGAYLTFKYVMSKIMTNVVPVEHNFKFSKTFSKVLPTLVFS